MNFFQNQETARRKTKILVFYYLIAVVAIILCTHVAIVASLFLGRSKLNEGGGAFGDQLLGENQLSALLLNPELFFSIVGVTVLVVLGGTLYKLAQLSQGGVSVARALGGRLVPTNTTDSEERKILNVVQEVAIASGTTVPPVYLMDNEAGINAFAAGYSPNDAVIGVTRGCVQLLSRDELQGVMAHEFSHILNGDMRLNIRLMGILHGILVIAIIGQVLLRGGFYSSHRRSRRDRDGNNLAIAGIALLVIGYLGVFFGKLIKSAISRQREFLADASAVQFTRNPSGIASALKKIGGFATGGRLRTPYAQEASHMYFANGLAAAWMNLLASHPPLDERIRRIDPSFGGSFSAVQAAYSSPSSGQYQQVISGFTSGNVSYAATVEQVVESVGAPTIEHLAYAKELIKSIPDEISSRIHEPFGARSVIYSILIDSDKRIKDKQLMVLSSEADTYVFQETLRILPEIKQLDNKFRIPLVDLALPALRELSDNQYASFRQNVEKLIDADNRLSLFEFALQHIMFRYLDSIYEKVSIPHIKYEKVSQVMSYSCQLLSALAYVGHDDLEGARTGFQAGMKELDVNFSAQLGPVADSNLSAVKLALNELEQAAPPLTQALLRACVACISSDGEVRSSEAELVRAIADALNCPLPPFLGPVQK